MPARQKSKAPLESRSDSSSRASDAGGGYGNAEAQEALSASAFGDLDALLALALEEEHEEEEEDSQGEEGGSGGGSGGSDLPEAPEGAAEAGAVSPSGEVKMTDKGAALGYIDLDAGKSKAQAPKLQFEILPERQDGNNKVFGVKVSGGTTVSDVNYPTFAVTANDYKIGTYTDPKDGKTYDKMITVSGEQADMIKTFEQQHIQDTIVAFNISLGALQSKFGDVKGQTFESTTSIEEAQVAARRAVAVAAGSEKLGSSSEDMWLTKYKQLVDLTFERDTSGSHTWGLGPPSWMETRRTSS